MSLVSNELGWTQATTPSCQFHRILTTDYTVSNRNETPTYYDDIRVSESHNTEYVSYRRTVYEFPVVIRNDY